MNGSGVRLKAFVAPEGDGVPFLLVHGLASTARTWELVMPLLAEAGHPVAAIDQRGHGLSDKPDEGYGFDLMTADLVAVIEALGWERPVAVGHSWGANVVLELACRRPEAVRGIACVDGAAAALSSWLPTWEECAERLAPPRLAGTPLADIERSVREAHPDWRDEAVRAALAGFERREDGTVAPWLTFERHMLILRAMWEQDPPALYPAIEVPVLLIPADADDAEWAERKRAAVGEAAGRLRKGEVHWLAGDHDVQLQQPEVVAGLLLSRAEAGFFS